MQSRKNYLFSFLITSVGIFLQSYLAMKFDMVVIGLLYPCSFLVAWYFGFGAALFSIGLAALGLDFFVFKPLMSFKILELQDAVRLGIYVGTSILTTWMVARSKKSFSQGTKAIEALTSIQTRFRRSAKSINLGIWYCDLPFDVLNWNAQVKEHFWLDEDAHITIDTFYERLHPDDREPTRQAIHNSIAHNMGYDIIYRTTNPQNPEEIKFIRAIGWTDYDKDKKPIRFDGVTIDNTPIRKVSDDLKTSLEVVETINQVGKSLSAELDQKKLVQQVTDAATQLCKAEFGAFFYTLVNEQGESYTLYSVSGVPLEKFNKFPMPRKTQIFAPTFDGVGIVRSDDITQDPRYGKNLPYHGMPAGHLPVVSYLAVPVISRSGQVIGGIFLGHQEKAKFTEREEKIVGGLASQIAIAMDNAKLFENAHAAVRIRDEFLSISSHELKTPLTSLKLQLQLFARTIMKGKELENKDEKIKHIVEVCERQVNRLNSLVEDLLDVSRISNGKLSLNYEEVNLPELVEEVLDRYRPMAVERKCPLEVHSVKKLMASVDRLRFEQVLINLMTNAIKYAPGTKIEVELSELGGDFNLSVKDHGPGINQKDQNRIFERFERVNTRDNQVGLGLGLYIVNQIVSAHGGSIKLESDLGQGSSFKVTLPVKPIPESPTLQ